MSTATTFINRYDKVTFHRVSRLPNHSHFEASANPIHHHEILAPCTRSGAGRKAACFSGPALDEKSKSVAIISTVWQKGRPQRRRRRQVALQLQQQASPSGETIRQGPAIRCGDTAIHVYHDGLDQDSARQVQDAPQQYQSLVLSGSQDWRRGLEWIRSVEP